MKLHIIVIVLLFISSFLANAGEKISTVKIAQLDQQLKLNTERYGVVGQSVQILKNNKLIYKSKYGFANAELAVPIADKHIYPSYSVTKLFTSVLVMHFVEKGIVDVKKSIRFYLPYLPKHWQKITVEHTLNHTSGIPRYFDIAMEKNHFLPTKKAVFLSLSEEPEHFEMGTENRYNNTNFLILSEILEIQSGKSYQALVQELIIRPLNLENTGHVSAKAVMANMVSSYQGKDGVLLKNNDIDWPEYTYAHSGLYSTAEDLSSFMTALVTGKLVSPESLQLLKQPMVLLNAQEGDYAFGFEYEKRDGYHQIGHDGGNRVKIRHYFKDAANQDSYTIAYLTNGNANSVWTDILADSLMAIIDPEHFKMAYLSQQFISAVLVQDSQNLQTIYKELSRVFDDEQSAIEYFIWYNAYGIRYSVGLQASLPAFDWLTLKFPDSAKAWRSLAGIWQEIGNKEKAIMCYKTALKLAPDSDNVIKQIELLAK
jgi:CubicO group peptidase (beta-lactamase class C family)